MNVPGPTREDTGQSWREAGSAGNQGDKVNREIRQHGANTVQQLVLPGPKTKASVIISPRSVTAECYANALTPSSSSSDPAESSSLVAPDGIRIQLRNQKQKHIFPLLPRFTPSIPCCVQDCSVRLNRSLIGRVRETRRASQTGLTSPPGQPTTNQSNPRLLSKHPLAACWTLFGWRRRRRRMSGKFPSSPSFLHGRRRGAASRLLQEPP